MEKDRINQLPDHLITRQFFPIKAVVPDVVKEDRISLLPDPLICQILDHLSTKQSVTTSVLSTRWRNLWLWVPCLELNSRNFPDFDAFVSFGDRFFDSNRVACLQKLDLTIYEERKRIVKDENDSVEDENGSVEDEDDSVAAKDIVKDVSYLTAWMDVAAKLKIQHFDFFWHGNLQVHTKHLRLHKCETLVSLKLSEVTFDDDGFVSFPCLKIMHLLGVLLPNKATFEKLISRCPVLEELEIHFTEDHNTSFQVHSQSLKRLTLVREFLEPEVAVPGELVIEAPLLYFLGIRDDSTVSVRVSNWESIAKLRTSLLFGFGGIDDLRRYNIRNFLYGISRVRDMTIYADSFQRFLEYSKVEPLPQFGFLYRLDVDLHASQLKCLPTFLESCPNLKSLHLNWVSGYEEVNQMSFSSVPKCLQSSLEFITITVPTTKCTAERKIVRYFLENSAIVKKFTLRLSKRNYWTHKYICEDLHKIPRGSTKCEVHVTVLPYWSSPE